MSKARKQIKVRNMDVVEMITGRKGGPHKDKREKRVNNPKYNSWND